MTVDGAMPHDAASWAHLTGSFAKLLAAEIDDADLFSLWPECICGIPRPGSGVSGFGRRFHQGRSRRRT
ncbi:hypothetical protein [Dactylosporangium sp. CA-139066]|uniref:hypothetical protein n=1 Tax=Dactylosporangium sp. CA-139066 TaxID=3239930 RepID=UPI003D8B1C2A